MKKPFIINVEELKAFLIERKLFARGEGKSLYVITSPLDIVGPVFVIVNDITKEEVRFTDASESVEYFNDLYVSGYDKRGWII
jgi:hypothetical protein